MRGTLIPSLLFLAIALGSAADELAALLPGGSVGTTDDALSTFINPSNLAFRKGFNACLSYGYRGRSKGEHVLAASIWGTGFGLQMIGGEEGFWRWTLSNGWRVIDRLSLGVAYSWFSSDDEEIDKLKIWDVGAAFRTRLLSIGLVLRNVNRPKLKGERINPVYEIGIGFRPGTDRLTLSMDLIRRRGEEGWRKVFAVEAIPVDGIALRVGAEGDGRFELTFSLNFSHFGVGSFNTFDSERELRDGIGLVYLSGPMMRSIFSRRREVLRVGSNAAEVLRRAMDDPGVVGAVLELDELSGGMGRLQELEGICRRFRSKGKKLFGYGVEISTGGYLIGSVCDELYIHPSGELKPVGLRAEQIFIKRLLERMGVEVEMVREGRYKSAPELFTRESSSPASREAEESLLDDLFDQLLEDISRNKGWGAEEVKRIIDGAPYTPSEAEEKGLVDGVIYRDQIEERVKKALGKVKLIDGSDYLRRRWAERSWAIPPKIALIKAEGVMVEGESYRDPISGLTLMGSRTICEALRKAREDRSIKAVVLRVDSGGGFVAAADDIWREVLLTKERKPVVVSMGDIAASGGYYIAAPADRIFAMPGTITGSIGVFSGLFSLKDFYRRIGVNKEILKRGENADLGSDSAELTPRKREAIAKQVREMYRSFLRK
ncbi:hypothetical protein DRP77_09080, partial [Candidatus Poribacteria bacterium]